MKRWLIALALACVALGYFSAFRGYGINLPDEGTLLYKFERAADGQRLYADFHAGYTPGVFYVHSFLLKYLGHSILPGRVMLAVVNSLSVAMLFLLAAPVCGNGFAALAALLYPAFMPVHPGHFASFNIPYPTWYSVALFLAGLLSAREFVAKPSPMRALTIGLLAGLGFLFKPNVGAFQLACGMLLVLAALPRRGSLPASTWWWLTWTAVLVGVLAVFGGWPGALEACVFLAPVFAAGLLVAARAGAVDGRARLATVGVPTLLVGAGFAAVTLSWLGYYATFVPFSQLLEEALFIGSDYAKFFYIGHPRLFARAGALAAGLAVLRWLPAWIAQHGRMPFRVAAVVAAVAAVVAVSVFSGRPMLQGFVASVMSEIEVSWSFAAAQAAIALLIAYSFRGQPVSGAVLVLAVGAPLLYLGNYPRTDFMHWLWAAPVAVLGGVCILGALAREWSRGVGRATGYLVACAIVAPLVLIAGLRVATSLAAIWRFDSGFPEYRASVELGSHRAPVWMNIGRAESYRDLDAVVAWLRDLTEPGEKVFTFPALDVVSFLADRDTPLRDSYFFPGWIGHDEEARAVRVMEDDPPRFVVALYDDWPFFDEAPRYYAALRGFVEREYRPYLRAGRYAILAHRSVTAPAPDGRGIRPHSEDPRLTQYLGSRIAAADARTLPSVVGDLRYDAIEGYYPALTELLRHDDGAVRVQAVSALRFAADDRAAAALWRAAVEGRLPERERLFALRLAGAWAGAVTAAEMASFTADADAAVATAARTGLAHHVEQSVRRAYWFGQGRGE